MTVKKNALFGMGAQMISGIISVMAMPLFMKYMGAHDLGLLSMLWLFMTYAVFMDFGVAKALTRAVSKVADVEQQALLYSTSLFLVGFGVFFVLFVVVFFSVVQPSFREWLSSKDALALAFFCVAPVCLMSNVSMAFLMARNRFDVVAVSSLLCTVGLYLPPLLLVSVFNLDVTHGFASVVAFRVLITIWLMYFCSRFVRFRLPTLVVGKELLAGGIWLGMAALASVILAAADRLFIATLIGAAALGAYSVVHTPLSRMSFISTSLSNAFFPVVAKESGKKIPIDISSFFFDIVSLLFPVCALLIGFSTAVLKLWLGAGFEKTMPLLAGLILLNVFVNAFAQLASTALQAQGRHRVVAVVQYLEIPILVALIYGLLPYGLSGVLIAVLVRSLLDACFFMALAGVSISVWMLFWFGVGGLFCVMELSIGMLGLGGSPDSFWFVISLVAIVEIVLFKFFNSGLFAYLKFGKVRV